MRLQTVGLNYAEVLSRKGLYGWAPSLPYVLGMEAFGHVDAVGDGVSGDAIGQPRIVGAQYGAYAEAIAVPEHQALPAFPRFSAEENAAYAVNFMTAWIT